MSASKSPGRQSTIDIVVHALPPAHDAIGEYTYCFAKEAAKSLHVRMLCPLQAAYQLPKGVRSDDCHRSSASGRFQGLVDALTRTDAEAVLLQYNPFGWGRRGWAPDLVRAMSQFRRLRPDVGLGIMFHERYTVRPGWRAWIMQLYQRRQFYQLVDVADVSFFSTGAWAEEERRRRPHATVIHAPVGSNLPDSDAPPAAAREKLGIEQKAFVCGVFGSAHPSRMVPWIEVAVNRFVELPEIGRHTVLLHVGRERLPWAHIRAPVVEAIGLNAQQAANSIAAMDLLLNPFTDGISTRRGSAIAALQQGVPIVSTIGVNTEELWSTYENTCVFLSAADNMEAWATKAVQAAESTRANAAEKRYACRDMFGNWFSWRKVVDRFVSPSLWSTTGKEF